ASLHGALGANWQWEGWLDSLHGRSTTKSPLTLTLRAPARLGLSAQRQSLQSVRLSVNAADVRIDNLQLEHKHMATKGSVRGLQWAELAPFLPPTLPVESDLVVNGDWDVSMDPELNGRLTLGRASGDISVKEPRQPLQLKVLLLALNARQGQVEAHLEMESGKAGQVSLSGRMQLSGEPFKTTWRQAPLAVSGKASLPSLVLLRPWLPAGTQVDARAGVAFEATGTWDRPEVNGSLNLDKLQVRVLDPGVRIVDGELGLTLKDRKIQVNKGLIKGQDGQIKLSGSADLNRDDAHLQLEFERFAALLQSGARMWVSGPAGLTLQKHRLGLSGTLKVDRARIEQLAGTRPRLSEDVVVKGAPAEKTRGSLAFPLDMALTLDLGDDVLFKGYGLDGKLAGALMFKSRAPEPLQASGAIRVVEGNYVAYGQKLKISQGTVRFIGPLNNPGLDMLAVRETGEITAGVQVSGTARNPRVALYSKPDMPDAEKLSWLVFGHGLSKVGEQQFGLLQVAASALLSQRQSSSLQRDIAQRLGIDTFDVRSGTGEDVASTVVSVGKRLSSKATLSYEQSLNGLSEVVKVIYQLKPAIRFEASTGSQSGFDAFYSHDFE
ncbi:MAG TPA: translocation/assembly module TamB domain-containing protein, partial [Thiobacillaceae bacterium]|nr:translocation/assembly module TamB domain-containing protein [Thiobacillaceae bacterium]